ncbi:hypothetical protein LTR94_028616, partial [Friedmanniomyces endolithicus]
MEFARHVLGQRQAANPVLRGYDQGFSLRKRGTSNSSPWVVGLGPVSVLALVHCSLAGTTGPRSVRRLSQHLAGYGAIVDYRDIATNDLGHQLRRNRMNRLASTIADLIRDKLSQAPGGERGEVRLIFHGPQKEILAKVFDLLAVDSEVGPKVPILLQLPSLAPGEENPPVGVSGCCDDTHLLNLRNSPSQPTFLALVPPGQHSMRSVTSTTDEFGVAAANNGGNVPFEDWWADEFIQKLVRVGVGQAGIQEQQQRDDARTL